MKALVIYLALLELSGCATGLPSTVEIPIAVKCATPGVVEPSWNVGGAIGRGVYEQMKALLADRELARAYEGELRTALVPC